MSDPSSPPAPPEHAACLQAVGEVLGPLARLLVGRGVHFGVVEEQLKIAFIAAARDAALQATPDALPHRLVSRVSTTTGINRREVTRLVQARLQQSSNQRSPALQAFARWSTDPAYQVEADVNADAAAPAGPQARTLPRQGPAPSFEALAASITRDVHPRSLLDDLIRLKLVAWDETSDCVRMIADAFVPRDDQVRMLGYLGSNVGDHLHAAVDNVLGDRPKQMEQAISAHGLSAASLARFRQSVNAQWRQLTAALVPELQALIEADEAAAQAALAAQALPGGSAAPATGRLRLGLYMLAQDPPGPAGASGSPGTAGAHGPADEPSGDE